MFRRILITLATLTLFTLTTAAVAQSPPAPSATPLPGCFWMPRQPDPALAPVATLLAGSPGAMSDGAHTFVYAWQTDTGTTNVSPPSAPVVVGGSGRAVSLRVFTGRDYRDGFGLDFPRMANVYKSTPAGYRYVRSVAVGRHHESFGAVNYVDLTVTESDAAVASNAQPPATNTTADCPLVVTPNGDVFIGVRDLRGIDAGAARTFVFGTEDPQGGAPHFILKGVSNPARPLGHVVAWFSVTDENLKSGGTTQLDNRIFGAEFGLAEGRNYFMKMGVGCGSSSEPCDNGLHMRGRDGTTVVGMGRVPGSDRRLTLQALPGDSGYILSGENSLGNAFRFDGQGNLVLKGGAFVAREPYGPSWAASSGAATKADLYAKLQTMGTGGTAPPQPQTVSASRLLGRGDSGAGAPQEISVGEGLRLEGTTLKAASAAPAPAPVYGEAVLASTHAVPADGAWVPTPLTVFLPSAGDYRVEADVAYSGQPGAALSAKLFNATTGQDVPDSVTLLKTFSGAEAGTVGFTKKVTAAGAAAITLYVRRGGAGAEVVSDARGRTRLLFERLGGAAAPQPPPPDVMLTYAELRARYGGEAMWAAARAVFGTSLTAAEADAWEAVLRGGLPAYMLGNEMLKARAAGRRAP